MTENMKPLAVIDEELKSGALDVRGALEAGRYTNLVPYSIEQTPVDENTMTVRQAREHVESEKARQRAQRDKHNAEESRLTTLLRADLERENKIEGHPKAGSLWEIAWSEGHSSGYGEVIQWYERLAELLR